jgi:hypothetical protein
MGKRVLGESCVEYATSSPTPSIDVRRLASNVERDRVWAAKSITWYLVLVQAPALGTVPSTNGVYAHSSQLTHNRASVRKVRDTATGTAVHVLQYYKALEYSMVRSILRTVSLVYGVRVQCMFNSYGRTRHSSNFMQ